jgi:hypothetical protein
MLDGMAELEEERLSARVDLTLAARVTGIAAIVLGIDELLVLVANFSITEQVLAVIGDVGVHWVLRSLWVISIAATAVAAGGIIVGWRQAPLLWTPGIGLVVLGVLLRWGWWAIDRYTDVWNLGRFTGVDPSDPELLNTFRAMEWVDTGVSIVTIALLLAGGIQLVRTRRRSESPESSDDDGAR